MTEKQLQELGLTEEQSAKVLELKGRAIAAVEAERDSAQTKLGEANKQISAANKQIESFEGMDIDGIKKAADEWRITAETAKKDADARIADLEYEALLKEGLAGVKFSSNLARNEAIRQIKEQGLKRDKDKILGLDDAIKAMQEADKGAFVLEEQAPTGQLPSGTKLVQPSDGGKKTPAGEWEAKLAEARKTSNLPAVIGIKQQAAAEGIILN